MLKRSLIFALALLGVAAVYAGKTQAQGTTPAVASPERAARIERARVTSQEYLDEHNLKDRAVIEDTGKDVDLGAGPGPVIVLKLPALGRVCLLALHPSEDLFATFSCEDVPPETGV